MGRHAERELTLAMIQELRESRTLGRLIITDPVLSPVS
jgi:hypothetical protein